MHNFSGRQLQLLKYQIKKRREKKRGRGHNGKIKCFIRPFRHFSNNLIAMSALWHSDEHEKKNRFFKNEINMTNVDIIILNIYYANSYTIVYMNMNDYYIYKYQIYITEIVIIVVIMMTLMTMIMEFCVKRIQSYTFSEWQIASFSHFYKILFEYKYILHDCELNQQQFSSGHFQFCLYDCYYCYDCVRPRCMHIKASFMTKY